MAKTIETIECPRVVLRVKMPAMYSARLWVVTRLISLADFVGSGILEIEIVDPEA
jgi:hypothetical protein